MTNQQGTMDTSSEKVDESVTIVKGNCGGGVGVETENVRRTSYYLKLGFAIIYAVSSFLLMSVNKIVLTSCKFPCPTVLVVGQIIATLVILHLGKKMGLIKFPDFNKDTFMTLNPLPTLYLANAVTGLVGTKELSLPMFTAIRRFGILMTMIGEYYVLGIKTPYMIQMSIYIMIAGSLLAAIHDVTFSVSGYTFVMLNNFLTAVKGVIIKKNWTQPSTDPMVLCTVDNALFMAIPAVLICFAIGEVDKAINYPHWTDVYFLVNFCLSCVLGFTLIWSVVQCTNYNSALTTAIVGTIKNISITYLGMFIGGDYVYEIYNFLGINLSVIGSLVYTLIIVKYPNS